MTKAAGRKWPSTKNSKELTTPFFEERGMKFAKWIRSYKIWDLWGQRMINIALLRTH